MLCDCCTSIGTITSSRAVSKNSANSITHMEARPRLMPCASSLLTSGLRIYANTAAMINGVSMPPRKWKKATKKAISRKPASHGSHGRFLLGRYMMV